MKRSRGRGRRQQNPVNRSYDSNGPDVRVRGTASQVYEKYQALARDAMASGDRVMAENYSQHGEHYYRILLSFQPAPGEGDKEMSADTANGEAKDGAVDTIQTDTNGNGTAEPSGEPLVLVRDASEDGDTGDADDKPAKPSRRRGLCVAKKRRAVMARMQMAMVQKILSLTPDPKPLPSQTPRAFLIPSNKLRLVSE